MCCFRIVKGEKHFKPRLTTPIKTGTWYLLIKGSFQISNEHPVSPRGRLGLTNKLKLSLISLSKGEGPRMYIE